MNKTKQPGTDTVAFYEQHSSVFFQDTVHLDMTALYQPFLPKVAAGGYILDAGCGSGRDSLYFKQHGFKVLAMDASNALATAAESYIGQAVQVCRFEDFTCDKETFDAIWCCASLLHVSAVNLPQVFSNLANGLKSNGVFYCSFKYGQSDSYRDGRYFTNLDEARLQALLSGTALQVESIWLTGDVRPQRQHEQWLNAILRKGA